jgi:hypothetical protein
MSPHGDLTFTRQYVIPYVAATNFIKDNRHSCCDTSPRVDISLTWWGGLLRQRMETKRFTIHNTPTCTPRLENPNLTPPQLTHTPSPTLTATYSNNTSSTPYIIPTPPSISSSTPSPTSSPTSPPPSNPAPLINLPDFEHFLLRRVDILAFLENSSASQ